MFDTCKNRCLFEYPTSLTWLPGEYASAMGSTFDIPVAYTNILGALGSLKWYYSSHPVVIVLFPLTAVVQTVVLTPSHLDIRTMHLL